MRARRLGTKAWIVVLITMAPCAAASEPDAPFEGTDNGCCQTSEELDTCGQLDSCGESDACGKKCDPRRRAMFAWTFLTGNVPEYEDPRDGPLDLDRPDFTEASTTVGRGLTVLESGYTFTRQNTLNRAHSYPESLLRVGMFADWYEFRIADNVLHQNGNDPVQPISAAGLEDLYVGSKFQLFMQDGWLPEAVIIPQMTIPTGHSMFTANQVLPGVNCVYGWGIGDKLGIGASTQGNRIVDGVGETYWEIDQSIAIDIPITERFGAYIEWFAFFPHGALSPEVGAEHYMDGGLAFLITDNFQIDIRAGFGLNERADDFFTGVGGGVRW